MARANASWDTRLVGITTHLLPVLALLAAISIHIQLFFDSLLKSILLYCAFNHFLHIPLIFTCIKVIVWINDF